MKKKPTTKQLAEFSAQPKSKVKPLYDVVAARREITDEDYARFDRLVPQGRHVIRDADEPWSCEIGHLCDETSE